MIPLQVEEFIVPLQSKPRAARFKVKKLLRSVQMRQSAFKVQSSSAALPAEGLTRPQGLTRCEAALPAALLPYPRLWRLVRPSGPLNL